MWFANFPLFSIFDFYVHEKLLVCFQIWYPIWCFSVFPTCILVQVSLQSEWQFKGVSKTQTSKTQTPDSKNSDPRVSRKLRPRKLRPSGLWRANFLVVQLHFEQVEMRLSQTAENVGCNVNKAWMEIRKARCNTVSLYTVVLCRELCRGEFGLDPWEKGTSTFLDGFFLMFFWVCVFETPEGLSFLGLSFRDTRGSEFFGSGFSRHPRVWVFWVWVWGLSFRGLSFRDTRNLMHLHWSWIATKCKCYWEECRCSTIHHSITSIRVLIIGKLKLSGFDGFVCSFWYNCIKFWGFWMIFFYSFSVKSNRPQRAPRGFRPVFCSAALPVNTCR